MHVAALLICGLLIIIPFITFFPFSFHCFDVVNTRRPHSDCLVSRVLLLLSRLAPSRRVRVMENVIMAAGDGLELEHMLGSMLTDQTYTDITFTFPDENQKSVGAHKNILAMSSPVFREMFFGTRKIESDMIAVTDIKYETFMKMLM